MSGQVRRSPEGVHRQRDADRTRQALIDAALLEFAAKGRNGARVSDIAARAGVNKQLISYYFGGKDGLYEAIAERWQAAEAQLAPPGTSVADMLVAYFRADGQGRDTVRIWVREGLDNPHGENEPDPDATVVPPEILDFRRRQAAGELASDLDPACLLLMFMSLSIVDVTIPHQIKKFTGLDPTSEQFRQLFSEQLRRLVAHLAPDDPPAPA
jgi:AcrR family transcriptional regulator